MVAAEPWVWFSVSHHFLCAHAHCFCFREAFDFVFLLTFKGIWKMLTQIERPRGSVCTLSGGMPAGTASSGPLLKSRRLFERR